MGIRKQADFAVLHEWLSSTELIETVPSHAVIEWALEIPCRWRRPDLRPARAGDRGRPMTAPTDPVRDEDRPTLTITPGIA